MEDSEGFAGDFAGSGLNTGGTEDTERFARDFAEMAKYMKHHTSISLQQSVYKGEALFTAYKAHSPIYLAL